MWNCIILRIESRRCQWYLCPYLFALIFVLRIVIWSDLQSWHAVA